MESKQDSQSIASEPKDIALQDMEAKDKAGRLKRITGELIESILASPIAQARLGGRTEKR